MYVRNLPKHCLMFQAQARTAYQRRESNRYQNARRLDAVQTGESVCTAFSVFGAGKGRCGVNMILNFINIAEKHSDKKASERPAGKRKL